MGNKCILPQDLFFAAALDQTRHPHTHMHFLLLGLAVFNIPPQHTLPCREKWKMNAHCLLFPPAADLWRLPPEVLFDTSLFPPETQLHPPEKRLEIDCRFEQNSFKSRYLLD